MPTTRTTNLSIRIDAKLKQEAEKLFADLGMNLTTAFNIFVRQAIRTQGIPFAIARDVPNEETLKAMEEARNLASGKGKSFTSMDDLVKDLNS
ncbi:MAG: type II toxin-antitoxin system RelB/DinJ family antitoxin [Victivallaceae bacterium]|nr:type II toxin-antitoxin system RelB/DinJ family antitoxin [Victivallaceae bacterium]